MWPFWKIRNEPKAGVFVFKCFAGFKMTCKAKEVPIMVLESLNGYLNIAAPISSTWDNNDPNDYNLIQASEEDAIAEGWKPQ